MDGTPPIPNGVKKMITVVNGKKDTQAQIKALRAAGLTVVKDSGGMYSCDMIQHATKNGVRTGATKTLRLFSAMPGRNGYLIRRQPDLFA
jgi:hypothetical protein